MHKIAAAAVTLALLPIATLVPAAAGAGGEGPLPEPGLLYASAPDDAQRVEFWVIGQGDDDELLLSMSVGARCVEGKKKLFGFGDFIGAVDEDGEISAAGPVSSSKPEDGPATSGVVELEGTMTADGGAKGTVSVDFKQTNEQDEDDVYARCEVDAEPWEVVRGTPDPDLERVEGIVPLEDNLDDPYSLTPVVADATDAYAVYQDVDDSVLRQLSLESGEGWAEDLDGVPQDLAIGDGVVWVGGLGSAKRPTVAGFDTRDGSEVARLAGEDVAVGPDGSVWVTSPRERAVRRLDPATGAVVAEVPLAGESFGSLAVGPEGLYLDLRPDAGGGEFGDIAFHRLDPQTGAVLATADDSLTDSPVYPDADGAGLWINEPRSVYRLDARTLAEIADSGVYALSEAPAGGGRLWVGGYQGLLGLDPSGEIGFEIPGLFGTVGSNGSTVLLMVQGLGMLRIDGS